MTYYKSREDLVKHYKELNKNIKNEENNSVNERIKNNKKIYKTLLLTIIFIIIIDYLIGGINLQVSSNNKYNRYYHKVTVNKKEASTIANYNTITFHIPRILTIVEKDYTNFNYGEGIIYVNGIDKIKLDTKTYKCDKNNCSKKLNNLKEVDNYDISMKIVKSDINKILYEGKYVSDISKYINEDKSELYKSYLVYLYYRNETRRDTIKFEIQKK